MTNQYYKKYNKQPEIKKTQKTSYMKLFLGAFSMMLIIFVIMALHLFSSVDTAIGENDEGDIKESGLGVRHLIDSRLKFIQMEDNDKLPSNQAPEIIQSKEKDFSVYTEKSKEGEVQTGTLENDNPFKGNNSFNNIQTTFTDTNIKHPTGVQQNSQPVRNTVYKVYIGTYSTLEQARVAQSIIQDSNLGVTPFVRTLGNGSYTIQVGSYSESSKALSVTNELRKNHFPARMSQE